MNTVVQSPCQTSKHPLGIKRASAISPARKNHFLFVAIEKYSMHPATPPVGIWAVPSDRQPAAQRRARLTDSPELPEESGQPRLHALSGRYSYRSASIGSTFAARRAGK